MQLLKAYKYNKWTASGDQPQSETFKHYLGITIVSTSIRSGSLRRRRVIKEIHMYRQLVFAVVAAVTIVFAPLEGASIPVVHSPDVSTAAYTPELGSTSDDGVIAR